MIHELSELLGTVKTKTTPYHPRSDGLVERFNRTLLAMLAMFVSQEHDNWDDLLPFMMLAYNTTVHTSTGFTPYRLVFGAIYQEMWFIGSCAQTLHQATLVHTPHGCSRPYMNHMMKCARSNNGKPPPPPARKNKLCSPWIGPYKIVCAPMEWVVGIQLDADARIVYVHMDDLKCCAPPDTEPTWPEAARGTSVVVSTRAPSTLARSDKTRSQQASIITSHVHRIGAHTDSINSEDTNLRAPPLSPLRSGAHHQNSPISDQVVVRAPTSEDVELNTNNDRHSVVTNYVAPNSTWNLQDKDCILSLRSECSIDIKGYRFFTMERLFYALQLLSLGDRQFLGQLVRYSRMDYVKKCVKARFELASRALQDKWLDDQYQTWTQIITARLLSD